MDIKFPPLPERIAQQISWFVKLVVYKPTKYSSVADNTSIIIVQSYTRINRASFRGGGGGGGGEGR